MGGAMKYYLVAEEALPAVFIKVAEAKQMLRSLSGRSHTVMTGFCLWRDGQYLELSMEMMAAPVITLAA